MTNSNRESQSPETFRQLVMFIWHVNTQNKQQKAGLLSLILSGILLIIAGYLSFHSSYHASIVLDFTAIILGIEVASALLVWGSIIERRQQDLRHHL